MRSIPVDDLIKPANVRKLIQKTVDTYPLAWKVVHEALQNAKDAIQKTGRAGTISITMDVASKTVSVKDDGCGFPYDLDLLGIGGTDKDAVDDWRIGGNQGVGIKAVLFSTSTFKLDAVSEGKRWQAWVDGAKDYLLGEPCSLQVAEPVDTPDKSGTTVEYSFPDDSITQFLNNVITEHYPHVHEHLGRDELERLKLAFEFYLRSYSYAGDVNRLLEADGIVPIRISLTIVGDVPTDLLESPLGEILRAQGKFEVAFDCRHWDVEEAVGRTRAGVPKPTLLDMPLPEGGHIGQYSDRYLYVGKFKSPEEFASLLRNPHLRTAIDVKQYEGLFEQLLGLYVVIGARPALLKYLLGQPRQFVAAEGIPSAHVLAGPSRGGEASYVSNNMHVIFNVNAPLNYGKQTIANPWLVGQISKFFNDAVRATLKNVAVHIVGFQGGSTTADDIESGLDVEIDILGRTDLAEGLLAFKKEPHDENAVIAIFNELIGKGYLRGYYTYSLHQKARYDGRAILMLPHQQGGRSRSPAAIFKTSSSRSA